MTVATELELKSFVLLRLGERRFAVAANEIAELVAPSRIYRFPHRTAKIEGVILRRGRIIPVCDVAETLTGKRVIDRRLYLIAVRRYGSTTEWVALPVTGECELITSELMEASPSDEPHVGGWLSHGGDAIEVLNLNALTPGAEEFWASSQIRSLRESQPAHPSDAETLP
jgi:chemotaxis signal transduction protein